MRFSTVTFIANKDLEIQKRFVRFLEQLSTLGYSIHTLLTPQHDNFKETLEVALRERDIVVICRPAEISRGYIYNVVSDIYKEALVQNDIIKEFLMKSNAEFEEADYCLPKYSKLLKRLGDSYPIVQVHRLLIIDARTFSADDENILVESLKNYTIKPVFMKQYSVTSSEKTERCLCKLLSLKNGVKIELLKNDRVHVITTTSSNIEYLNCLQNDLYKAIGEEIESVDFNHDCQEYLMTSEENHIKDAVNLLEECFNKYRPENVFISFNGGKDCMVLLHMMVVILKNKYPDYKEPIVCLYVKSKNTFSEVNEFIKTIMEYYNLNVITITSGIKDALEHVLIDRPNLKACLMGTRRTDPFSENLEHFQLTDNGWPSVMRVSPLLDWDYVAIWDYLIDFKVPYCSLYDRGYTSLGNINNTIENPVLRLDNGSYLPAHKLFDGSKERSGRL